MKQNKPKILFYDIETSLLFMQGFRMGEQRVNHGQLMGGYFSRSHIICISYKWKGEKTTYTLDWGEGPADEKKMLIEFDKVIKQADIVIGKNSDRFDNKHINTHRMWNNLPPMPEWTKHTDDVEKQLRKYFDVPSQSLDYWSSQLGLGGKDKMEFGDWVAINRLRLIDLIGSVVGNELTQSLFGKDLLDVVKEGEKALAKMIKYNKKDVTDTENVWNTVEKHCIPKHNMHLIMYPDSKVAGCRECGGTNISPNGSKVSGNNRYNYFSCDDCHQCAGRSLKPNPTKLS